MAHSKHLTSGLAQTLATQNVLLALNSLSPCCAKPADINLLAAASWRDWEVISSGVGAL